MINITNQLFWSQNIPINDQRSIDDTNNIKILLNNYDNNTNKKNKKILENSTKNKKI